jgi:hypothetical protein
MKNETEYLLLIAFVAFLLVKKFVALIVEVKFPTYEDLDKASAVWKLLVKVRSMFNFITILITSYFLYNYKFVPAARLIFMLLWIRGIFYFLIDDQLVWLFINKTPNTRKVVHFLNTYGDSITDFLITVVAVYALAIIFAPK